MYKSIIPKIGVIVALIFLSSCEPKVNNEVSKTIIIGNDTVYLNVHGEVIQKP